MFLKFLLRFPAGLCFHILQNLSFEKLCKNLEETKPFNGHIAGSYNDLLNATLWIFLLLSGTWNMILVVDMPIFPDNFSHL